MLLLQLYTTLMIYMITILEFNVEEDSVYKDFVE